MFERTSSATFTPSLWFTALLWLAAGCSGYGGQERLSAAGRGDLAFLLGERTAPDARERAVCGHGGPTPIGDQALTRGPFLQQVGATEALIVWRSLRPTTATVELWSEGGPPLKAPPIEQDETVPGPLGTQYIARLSGLEPSALYCYRVLGKDGPLTASAGFRTAPPAGQADPVRFAVMGDSGTGGEAQLAVASQLRELPFDFVLHTGDVAYAAATPDNLTRLFFDIYGDLLQSLPVYVAAGNHDYQAERGAPLRRALVLPENERYYAFDRGPVHVVVLDTERDTEAQLRWFAADLEANRLPWVVVAMHRPPYSSGNHGPSPKLQARYVPLFEAHDVALVVSGHEHNYERTQPINGVTYVVSGGGGRGVRGVDRSDFTAFSEAVNHLVLVEIIGDELVLHAIDATGVEFDSAKVQRPSAG